MIASANPTSVDLRNAQLAADVLRMRSDNKGWKEIAETLGIRTWTAQKIVQQAVVEYHESAQLSTRNYVEIQWAWCEILLDEWLPKARRNASALQGVMKIMERMAALRGLDAPKQPLQDDGTMIRFLPREQLRERVQQRLMELQAKNPGKENENVTSE